jgi:chromosomal replication initiation ATPase DnaA
MEIIKRIQELTAEIDQKTAELNSLYLRGKPLDALMKTVSAALGVSVEDIKHGSRKRKNTIARQVFAYVANKYLKIHVSEVAEYLHKNRTTVIYYVDVISDLLSVNDEETTKTINKINTYQYGNENSTLQPYL